MIELRHGTAKLVVDPNGGYIEAFSLDGEAILFAAELQGKRRATHVCVPNFGPDASGKLDQHGFGRKVTWQVVSVEEDRATLGYTQMEGEYSGLAVTLEYVLGDDLLLLRLSCHNMSDSNMWLAPGFHPYFVVPEGATEALFDGTVYAIDSLAGSEFLPTGQPVHEVKLGGRTLQFESDVLTTYVLWSEEPSSYVCVEPTLNGNSFSDHSTPPESELLAPGEKKEYVATLRALEI